MITWFDALLVTLLAAATALGALRGLAGLVWGVGGVAVCFLCNALFAGWPALPVALVLGLGVAWAARQVSVSMGGALEVWHVALGGLGGLLIGAVLIGSLALGLPIDPVSNQYPSSALPAAVQEAVSRSYIQMRLFPVFEGSSALQTLLIPDRIPR
ncbi:hypothetical protein [Deinococcus sp.]|uniref:hypothetical protein n=1 Tax=Deinococcus sp. TaxID=47478 RepID=UPI003B5B7730